ncbi:Uncharacterised protein [Mycobacteroides abscessus subsp. abscessus]|nr:Uncharacterised protein [Mycobacteroides abscessus subsp. abscessus]
MCSATLAANAPAAEVNRTPGCRSKTPRANQSSTPAAGNCTHSTVSGSRCGNSAAEPTQIRARAASRSTSFAPPSLIAFSSIAGVCPVGPIAIGTTV